MSVVNVEPLIHGDLLATKLCIKLADTNGNLDKDNVLNVLLNCGLSLEFDEQKLDLYKKKLEDIDVILVTDGDFAHSGAIPWLVSKYFSDRRSESFPKLLCTEGTYKFMRACFIDVLENVNFTKTFDYYTPDDLEFFNLNCIKLRYRETYCYTKKFNNLEFRTSFSAINNGYSIGGAVWSISLGFNTIICGDKIRIHPSTLLNGTNVNELYRPDLLLLSHEELEISQHLSDPQVVEVCNDLDTLLDRVVSSLNNGGNVLFPMDVDYKLINLLIHLNMIWTTSHASQFKIVLASPIADKILLFIGTCLEYLKSNIFHNFIKTLWNPLIDLSKIDIITSLTQLSKYRFRPTVFISTSSSIDFGFSNFLFVAIASYYKNLVVLTRPNQSVTKYIFNQSSRDSHLPQYKLQINLKNTKPQEGPSESMDETENKESSQFDSFGDLGTHGPYTNVHSAAAQNTDRDAKNTQDYGLPFDDFLADPVNPYGNINLPQYEEYEEESEHSEYDDEKTLVEDYYRKYIDDNKNSLFDIETESTEESQPKTDLLIKKFPFVVKSQMCMSNCFSNVLKQPQMASLLYRTLPRNVVLIPNSASSSKNEQYLYDLLKCKIHSFYDKQATKNKTKVKNLENQDNMNTLVSINMNLTNYPVLLDKQLLSSVRNVLNKKRSGELKRSVSAKYERIDNVISSIQKWKNNNHKEKTCQIISKLTSVEDSQQDLTTSTKIINCHTFWSEESNKKTKLEFKLDTYEKLDPTNTDLNVKMGLDNTLLVGNVSISNYASFMDDCLPNAVNMESGSIIINDKVKVSKRSVDEHNEWVVEGTLDPSYYLARKLIRKIHNTIEPIY